MLRRVLVPIVQAGEMSLDAPAAHHVRDVLRMEAGAELELFDSAGATGRGVIAACGAAGVVVSVCDARGPAAGAFRWTVAAAVPKAARADWMVEKLSELGASAYVPLAAARSVSLPEGAGKRGRWERLAGEAARQSRRAGVMRIEELTTVGDLLRRQCDPTSAAGRCWYLSTEAGATPIGEAAETFCGDATADGLCLLVGPEGGWTAAEVDQFAQSGLTAVALTATILRVETAAVAAAALVATIIAPRRASGRAAVAAPLPTQP